MTMLRFIKYIRLIISICLISNSYANAQGIHSKVLDLSKKTPLSYVSIGVVGKKMATLSDEKGEFSFQLGLEQHLGDTLKIGAIGFKAKYYIIKEGAFLPPEIFLEEDIIALKEVSISRVDYNIEQTIGTKSESSNTITGWGRFGMGGERGIKISLGEKKAFIKSANFYIRQNKFEEVLFRIHMRSLKNNIPANEIIDNNILVNTSVTRGWVQVDLSEYNIIADNDIMVSLEVIKAKGQCAEGPCLIFSGQLLKGVLYAKEAYEDRWVIKKRFSPSIYLTVLYP